MFLDSIVLLDNSIYIIGDQVHDVGVIERLHCFYFSHHQFQKLFIEVGVPLLEDLHCEVLSIGLVIAQLDFGVGSRAESLEQSVVA